MKIYLAGDMLNKGSQMQRAEEREQIKALGHSLYVPQDNKEINDKANLNSNDGLAERIVKADTIGIQESDAVVMEAREGALGTCIELGQIKGQRDMAKRILGIIMGSQSEPLDDLDAIAKACLAELQRPVLVHNSDIRRQGEPTETGDRRAYGPHQYMYGVVLDVTDGHGYYEWDEIISYLKAV